MSFRPHAAAVLLVAVLIAVWVVRRPTLPTDGPGANPDPGPEAGTPASGASVADRPPVTPVRDGPSWRPSARTLTADLAARALDLSRREYLPPAGSVPPELASLDFDGYRSIRFRPESAVWRGSGTFELQLFHLGSIYDTPVRLHLVEGDSIRTLGYDAALFAFEGSAAPLAALPPGAVPGFAGFRVHHPLNRSDVMDEVVSFLGASYFRLLGAGQEYGLSARGIAVDPAVEGPEEFPSFREFWVERPGTGAETLVIHALLDSPSLAGAYRFELTPGASTEMVVEASLFPRRDIRKLGVAPMSSMFLHAPGHGPLHDDFRPRVHDSDGLQMRTGRGEWIWRPLGNGEGLRVTSLRDERPAGFGLFQRARGFDAYLDLEARYHLRPSYWVEVLDGDWGPGGVELLEIPSPSEFNDNIAAYWVPDRAPRRGDELQFRYGLSTRDALPPGLELAHVARTAVGWDALPGQSDPPPRSRRRFVVDFSGGSLPQATADDELVADLSVLRGRIEGVMIQELPGTSGVRVTFSLIPDGLEPADMRLFLASGGIPVSETWSYVWYPRRND